MAVWTLWHPVYRLDGVIKAITALASLPTAMLLVRLVPQAVSLPSPEQLKKANQALASEVSERKIAEERISLLNAELEQRVKERTRDLERANEQLRQMNEDLKHFAYAASHDLQEPLRTVISYNQLLARDFGERLPEAAQSFIGFSVEGAQRIQKLLSGLREYWEASDRGEDQRTLVRCEDVVQKAILHLGTAIEESGASVTWGPLPALVTEEIMLFQLFQNLIGNAIKYRTEQPPQIHITAKHTGESWLFSVSDNGSGIPLEYRQKVFGIFKRLHGRDIEGVGIGLALCRKVVERYGGRIWIDEPENGVGATFKVTIPDKGTEAPTRPSQVASSSAATATPS
jgi:light-regulated signal transduction histidine kinase (bacteriophytochrome)